MTKANLQYDEIITELKQAKSAVVVAHVNPDGDTLGSMLALAKVLEDYGVETVHRVMHDKVPEVYKFFPDQEKVLCSLEADDQAKLLDSYDLSFSCDCGSVARLGSAGRIWERARVTCNVDHHLSNPLYADLNLVDSNATCTGQVVKALMDKINLSSGSDGSNNSQTSAPATDLSLPASAAKVETDKEILTIDQDLASLLYITLLTDTGGFRHSNTTPEVFKWAAELCDQGANPSYLYQQLYSQMPYKTLKIISAALNSMELTEVAGLKIVTTVTTKADLEKYEASDEDTDEIVDHLMRIKDVDMCIYLRQDSADHENGSYKGSLRSACHIDCSEIASELNGGGHARAAGFNLTAKSFDEIFELVLNKIKDKQATTA